MLNPLQRGWPGWGFKMEILILYIPFIHVNLTYFDLE
jgi:hypothetical protein